MAIVSDLEQDPCCLRTMNPVLAVSGCCDISMTSSGSTNYSHQGVPHYLPSQFLLCLSSQGSNSLFLLFDHIVTTYVLNSVIPPTPCQHFMAVGGGFFSVIYSQSTTVKFWKLEANLSLSQRLLFCKVLGLNLA